MPESCLNWQRRGGEFGVPEQALPLYRELKALPKAQGLPPKDMPRLYLRLGSTLFDLHEFGEALTVIEEGVAATSCLSPSARLPHIHTQRKWLARPRLARCARSDVGIFGALALGYLRKRDQANCQ